MPLRRHGHRLAEALEGAPLAVCLVRGHAHVVEMINRAGCAALGVDEPSAVGRPLFELVERVQARALEEHMADARATRTRRAAHEQLIVAGRADGDVERRYFDLLIEPLGEDARGCAESLLIIATDVTGRVEGQREIERAHRIEEQARARLARLAEAALAVARPSTIEDLAAVAAEQARSLIGAHRCVVSLAIEGSDSVHAITCSGDGLRERTPGDAHVFSVARSARTPFVLSRAELLDELLRADAVPDTEDLDVRGDMNGCIAAPLRGVADEYLGVMALFGRLKGSFGEEDVADLAHLALCTAAGADKMRFFDLARRERDRAEAANVAKDEFLAAVSHDLRTPLNALLGWAQLLKEQDGARPSTPAEIERGLNVIERNAIALARLVDDLLDGSQILSGRATVTFDDVDVVELAGRAVENVRVAADTKSITIETRLPDHGVTVRGDERRLTQVLTNLLENALKFTAAGGHVTVAVQTSGRRVGIEVADDGVGFDPADAVRLFERFTQGKAGTQRKGLGLGLSIVKQLVEMHGGSVVATSDGPGHGARFEIQLPREKPSDRAVRVSRSARIRLGHGLNDLDILVVDDDPDACELLASVFHRYGARATIAFHGAEALERLAEKSFAVVVTDLAMARMDGHELIRRIRASDGADAPVILALTANPQPRQRMLSMLEGADAHLTKPVDAEELLVQVMSALQRRRTVARDTPDTA